MAAFPEIVDGFELSPENMGILADAFRERLMALAVDPYSAYGPTAATKAAYYDRPMLALIQGDATERCCWRQMQEDLEWMALRYADPASSANVSYPVQLYADLSAWRAAAGLPSGGFRRGEDGTDYGLIAHRDPLRGWILQDIIIGLKSLVWTRSQIALTDLERRLATDPGTHSSLAAAIAAGDAIWAAAAWESGGDSWRQSSFEVVEPGSAGNYKAIGWALRAKGKITFAEAAPADYSAEFWTWGWKMLAHHWYDLEGHAEETWTLVESVAGAANDASVTMAGTSIDSPSATPYADTIDAVNHDADSIGRPSCILKWNFSHS
jgi:hypothetical protein